MLAKCMYIQALSSFTRNTTGSTMLASSAVLLAPVDDIVVNYFSRKHALNTLNARLTAVETNSRAAKRMAEMDGHYTTMK